MVNEEETKQQTFPINIDLNKQNPFNPHAEHSALQQTWAKWLKRFENFILAAEISNDNRKKAILLNLVGEEVADIFENLPNTGNTYKSQISCGCFKFIF